MSEWTKIVDNKSLPVDGIIVETKIDDEQGIRNEAFLIRKNNIWWSKDMSIYIYYRPTHWRYL